MSPLPTDSKMSWPPPAADSGDIACWSAWYSGSAAELAVHGTSPSSADRTSRLLGGFWRKRQTATPDINQVRVVHVPAAAEIAAVSADLLFGDTPGLKCSDEVAQARLEDLIDESAMQNVLLEGAEVCAGLGGVYLRTSWDREVSDAPFLTVVHADHAVPEFRYGILRAVTFWETLESGAKNVTWRHLERHEQGGILHGLYRGTATSLGVSIPLENSPQTEGLLPSYALPAGLPRPFLVSYVPNVRPSRTNRRSPLGRSDYAGAEGLLEALDETYSSWMRDIELGKARILVPRGALDPGKRGGGRGAGKTFDLDRAVFTELQLDPSSPGSTITANQFAIRAADHAATAMDLLEKIVSSAGYSPQSFGIRIEGRAESGTALRFRMDRTIHTVARKQRYFAPAITDQCENLLAVDALVLEHSDTRVDRPKITWWEESQGPLELAQTLDLLARAEAMSIETRVRMAQPGLDDDKVKEEVARIQNDAGSLMPLPPTMP